MADDAKNAGDTAWVSRVNFARKAGLQYDGARDIYKVAGYIPENSLDFSDYWSAYERQDIAGRIVDAEPEATWKNDPDLNEPDMDPEKPSEFVKEARALASRLRLWHYMERADRLSRVGRYGVLFIGARATDQELSRPLLRLSGPNDILYVSPYAENWAQVQKWVTDTSDPNFGRVARYQIELAGGVTGFPGATAQVDASRVIHLAEDLLDNEVFGRPILKRVMNRLFDLEKVTAATAESFWQLADRILQVTIDKDVQLSKEERKDLDEDVAALYHDLRRTFYGRGMEMGWIGGDSPDPSAAADLYMMLIAAASGIPKRILFGTETGERASEQDERQWHGRIVARQEGYVSPSIIRPFFDKLINVGALPQPQSGEYLIEWPDLYEASEKEQAETNFARARIAKELTPIGGSPLDLVEIDDDRNVWLLPSSQLEERDADRGAPGGMGGDDLDGDTLGGTELEDMG